MLSHCWHQILGTIIFIMSFAVTNGRSLSNFNMFNGSYPVIMVDKARSGQFSTIQSAIDSIPSENTKWVIVKVKAGIYWEKVVIPQNKPFIVLQGEGMFKTKIVCDDHDNLLQSATFRVLANDFVAANIGFMNSYSHDAIAKNPSIQAAAALINGDRAAFYNCSFYGLQDTLWDNQGRHYFKGCYIEGAVDFICGNAQSIYKKCQISVIDKELGPKRIGYITAQRRSSATDGTAFVFEECKVKGNGKAFLGRAWGPYSAVLYYKSYLSDLVVPAGWDAWSARGHENNTMYAEHNNYGPGSDTSNRVPWMRKLDNNTLKRYTDLSFINSDRWIQSQPSITL
ncbi:Pectinesterase, catalytic [Dillenia turbinata]|uniref:pectinesterase n=1 Tax=Dillenia turbinata TaxID=194707 RepID=A0AAN8VAE7_9MAGN